MWSGRGHFGSRSGDNGSKVRSRASDSEIRVDSWSVLGRRGPGSDLKQRPGYVKDSSGRRRGPRPDQGYGPVCGISPRSYRGS